MITLQDTSQQLQQNRLPRRTREVPLLEADGCVLAEIVRAPFDSPRFDNSAMDGFAVRWEDVKQARFDSSITLQVVGESKAGEPWDGKLKEDEAVRINTGAVVPKEADTVVPIEDCSSESGDKTVTIQKVKQAGNHIRRKGEEYEKGDRLYEEGTGVNPAVIGGLADIGRDMVKIYDEPRVTLLVTGSELSKPGEGELDEGQIYDSNRPMLHSYLSRVGIDPVAVEHVSDDKEETFRAVQHACESSDIVISTGGVSVGPQDHIPGAAREAGLQPVFHKVAQKPGKPFFFAAGNETLYFGLPGNPVSAFMVFTYHVYPELCHYRGFEEAFQKRTGIFDGTVDNHRNRSLLLRVRATEQDNQFVISPLERQHSHMIHAMSAANAFIVIPPDTKINADEEVTFHYFPFS